MRVMGWSWAVIGLPPAHRGAYPDLRARASPGHARLVCTSLTAAKAWLVSAAVTIGKRPVSEVARSYDVTAVASDWVAASALAAALSAGSFVRRISTSVKNFDDVSGVKTTGSGSWFKVATK